MPLPALYPISPPVRPQPVVVDFTGTASTVINAIANNYIYVFRVRLFVEGGASIQFLSRDGSNNDTIIFPDVAFSSTTDTVAYFYDLTSDGNLWVPEFATLSGGALRIALGSSARCRGTILYTPVPAIQ